uniref:Uncharacterized protein n=1 Tax=Branchiostoma floridae TaxID=7739 RepID=C3YTK2_BRAFL|eukprot:XP_002600117.1 hypothetical protein BRAFLDRAFT_66626 [Branchiostoma floridae]
MESGAIPDGSIIASSTYRNNPSLAAHFGRLNGGSCWIAGSQTIGQYLQVFPGNNDWGTPVTNLLNYSVDARHLRFVAHSWRSHISMRVEILGCNSTAVLPACPQFPQRLGMRSGAIPDDSITASSYRAGLEPFRGRANGPGAWTPLFDAIGQWLQVDLGEMKRVMGTIIQGRFGIAQWATSYKLHYSTNWITWTTYVGSNGLEMVFPGNWLPVTNLLDNPVDARYVRFVAQTWTWHIAMRVEIVGCNCTAVPPTCPRLLGMESGAIPDGSITASSTYGPDYQPYGGRLNGNAWIPKYSLSGQWLQVDLGEMKGVMGTIIQGRLFGQHSRGRWGDWVTSYRLQYSADRITWTTYADNDGSEMVFPGNTNSFTTVTNLLNYSVDARYVRFVVQSWDDRFIGMRVEVVGCNTTAVPPTCPRLLGMESGAIPDGNITASSTYGPDFAPYRGRLNGPALTTWKAMHSLTGQWLQVFPGNTDGWTPVTNLLNYSVDAQYVRFVVQSWLAGGRIAMRVEVVGCNTMNSPFIVEVKVNTSGYGLIYLYRWDDDTAENQDGYRVELRSGQSHIARNTRDAGLDNVASYHSSDMTSAEEFRRFWICWSKGGSVGVGRAGEVEPFMGWTDPHPVTNIGRVGYGTGVVPGDFMFNCSQDGFPGVCVDPPTQANTTGPVCDCPYLLGENCTYPCSPGYRVISGDVITRICTADGSWTEPHLFCQEMDECLTQNGGCSQTCTNTIGSYSCSCSEGFALDGDGHTCADFDECLIRNGGCGQVCNNAVGRYSCSCWEGFRLDDFLHNCNDVDECSTRNGGCSQFCTNTVGGYNCSCSEGFVLGWDGQSCIELSTTRSATTRQTTAPTTSPTPSILSFLTQKQTSSARLMDTSTAPTTALMPTSSSKTVKTTTLYVFGALDGESSNYMDDEAFSLSTMATLPTMPPSTAEPTSPPPTVTTTQESSTQAPFLIEYSREDNKVLMVLCNDFKKLIDVRSTDHSPMEQLIQEKKEKERLKSRVMSETRDMLALLDAAADKLLEETPGEVEGTHIRSDGVLTAVKKSIPDVGTVPISQDVGSIVFTKDDNLPENSTMKVVAFVEDPFVWSVEQTEVTSSVVMATITKEKDLPDASSLQPNITVVFKQRVQFGTTGDTGEQYHDTLPTSYRQNLDDAGRSFPLTKVPSRDTNMKHHAMYIADGGQVPLLRFSVDDVDTELQVYLRFHDFPTEEEYDYTTTVKPPEVTDYNGFDMPFGLVYSNFNVSFVPEIRMESGWLMVGVKRKGGDVIPAGFALQTAAVSCLMRENENQTWNNRRCQSHVAQRTAVADSIALGQAAKFATRNPNMQVVPKVSTIPSEVPGADYVYVVSVRTGTQPDAGTASVVGLMITGSEGRTAMVTLNPDGLILARGGDTYHIMTTPASVGELQSVQVWHDSSGKGAMESLFIDNIKVWDIQTSQGFSFPCYSWLSSRKGDGRTIRTLKAADEKMEMSEYTLPTFSYLLYDDHLLLSAVCNSGVRHFSRAQRLVCCLAQTTLWMVGSAMWYGVRLGVHDVILFDAGVTTLRLSELIGTAATSFTVFLPVYAILVPMFRKQPPLNDQPTSPPTRRFPYKAVAWILAILTSVCSSVFVIVYSLQFGAERSQAWLKDFVLAFLFSTFLLEPVQVSMCFKSFLRFYSVDVPAQRVLPPAPRKTDHDPNWTERMTNGRNILVLLVFLLIFTGNAFYIGILGFDRHAYHIGTSLENSLLSGYDEVSTADGAWKWLSSELIPSLHPERGYSGQKLSWLDKQFPAETNAFRIGPVRLERTTEYPGDPIDMHLETRNQRLYPELLMNLINGALGRRSEQACSYNRTTSIVNGVRNGSSACLTTVDLPRDADQAAAVIDFLKQTDWILMVSDTLIVRINFYHPDVKLFSSVSFRLQYLPGGAAELQPSIQTFRLFQYQTADDYVQLLFNILFVLFYIYNIFNEIWNIRKSGRLYFASFWNILILCNIGLSTAAIVTFVIRYIQAAAALRDIQQAKWLFGINEYVDISTAGQWDATFKEVLSFSIFISTFSILRVLNFSRGVATVYALPRLIYGEAFGFAVYMLVIIVAYSFSGILIFGKNMETFSNFKKTSYVLFEMGLGRPFVGVFADDMKAVDRVMGPLYYSTFVMVFVFYLMNLGVGMLCNWLSYCQTAEDIGVDTAMGDYFWNSFRSLLGMRHEPQASDDEAPLPAHFMDETLQRTDTVLQEVDRVTDLMYKLECQRRQLTHVQPSTSQA